MSYLTAEHSYGNKVTGRMLEDHFHGLPYGWERDVLYVTLASLLRAGVIEITYQGRRFRNHLDAQVRAAFAALNAFRSASFAPRKAPDLRTLVNAAKRYEDLTGEDVDVDEAAIAQAFQKLAAAELQALLPVEAVAKANNIPVVDLLQEYRNTLTSITQGASDDVVNILDGEGESFKQLRQQFNEVKAATNEDGLKRVHRARTAVNQVWPILADRGIDSGVEEASANLSQLLTDGSYYRFTAKADQDIEKLETAYLELYCQQHKRRATAYQDVIDGIKGLQEWTLLSEEFQTNVLAPLATRFCEEVQIEPGQTACQKCGANLPQMESDLSAVLGLKSEVLRRIQKHLEPEEKIEHVRLVDLIDHYQAINSPEEVEQILEDLKEHLLKLLASGSKIILE